MEQNNKDIEKPKLIANPLFQQLIDGTIHQQLTNPIQQIITTNNQSKDHLQNQGNTNKQQLSKQEFEQGAKQLLKQAVKQKDFSRVSSSPASSSASNTPQSKDQNWQYESIKQRNSAQKDLQQEGKPQTKQVQPLKQYNRVIRYKYCCKKCKHADRDKDKKACVCVVPRDQRRTHLGDQGCQTCGCSGCSRQDFIFRGEDPQYHPEDRKQQNKAKQFTQSFQARNGCCKNCMKAFSKSNKSCICQVPQDVRKTKLSSTGCKICGCVGCNPEDKKMHQKSDRKVRRSRSRSQQRKDRKRSRSRERKKRSQSRSPQSIDLVAMNFHNIDRSIIGSMIINEYNIDPALIGFGIPQRTNAYISGKTKQK